MAALALQLTTAGLAAVTAPDGTARTVIAALGLTAQPFIAAPTLTALPGEFKRLDILSGVAAAPNVAHITAYDTSAEVWNASGFGLYLEDGTLFASFSAADPVLSKAGVAFALMAFDIVISADVLAEIAFGDATFTWPPATEDTRGIVELATPAEAAGGTDALRALSPASAKAALLSWLAAQDGAGSGIDADLLDGQHGAWYADIAARLGYTPLDAASYTAADVLAKLLTVDGWGSGIDADTLDGHHGADYQRVTASNLIANGGYRVNADGTKECWGYVDLTGDSAGTFVLPVPHTDWVHPSIAVYVAPGNTTQSDNCGITAIVGTPPTAINLYNAENFVVRAWVRTIGV